tara:strand:- start:484 stop:951 length:468 start_codon:yes stop_codon:yes gene_type:complete
MNELKFSSSTIKNVNFGKRVKVIKPCNLYDCLLADDVFIGPFVEIQSDVEVGAYTKIQSHSFVCSLVTIGENCFVGHGVMFINDTFSQGSSAGGDQTKWKKTSVGDNVSIGSNSTILPVKICNNVVIGAGSVVTKDIKKSGIYSGNPAKFMRKIK